MSKKDIVLERLARARLAKAQREFDFIRARKTGVWESDGGFGSKRRELNEEELFERNLEIQVDDARIGFLVETLHAIAEEADSSEQSESRDAS